MTSNMYDMEFMKHKSHFFFVHQRYKFGSHLRQDVTWSLSNYICLLQFWFFFLDISHGFLDIVFFIINWNIRKAINYKVYKHLNQDQQEVLKIVETETIIWEMTVINEQHHIAFSLVTSGLTWYRCYIDGFWKENGKLSGLSWSCF